MKLKAICITGGCAHMCALKALSRHFKLAHMDATYMIRNVNVVEAPMEESEGEGKEEDDECDEDNKTGHENMQEAARRMKVMLSWTTQWLKWTKQTRRKRGELRMTCQRGTTSKRRRREKMLKRRHAMKQLETQITTTKLEKVGKKTMACRTWIASLLRLTTAHLTMILWWNKNSSRTNC
jgi:hypothetical protein